MDRNVLIAGGVLGLMLLLSRRAIAAPPSALVKKALQDGWVWPVPKNTVLTSPFGPRKDPKTGEPALHNGLDLAAKVNTPILMPVHGTVIQTGSDSLNGNFVRVKHTDKFTSGYSHLNQVDVRKGQTLRTGAVIGGMGNTGKSTGSHLHFTLFYEGKAIDPLLILGALAKGQTLS